MKGAQDFFAELEPGKSLIFYYANFSNPFTEEDERKYVLIGIARLKEIGDILYYDNCSQETINKHGGFVWARNITSEYPDQGLKLPHQLFQEQPEFVSLLQPENPRNFKYTTRHISDDDALVLVEQFLNIVKKAEEMGDTNENWTERIHWLNRLIAELWDNRGLYPGLSGVLEYLGFSEAISYFKHQCEQRNESQACNDIFAFLENGTPIPGLNLADLRTSKIKREWALKEDDERQMLKDILPRFDLEADQLRNIFAKNREKNDLIWYYNHFHYFFLFGRHRLFGTQISPSKR